MTDLLPARQIIRYDEARKREGPAVHDRVSLDYDQRLLRRRRLVTVRGDSFVVDLHETVSLNAGDFLVLEDGRAVEVIAAAEDLYAVAGDLPRLAWHIGNRHTPCQIEADRLLIRRDPVLRHMLKHLGASVAEVTGPFTPEGGAYGHGRTMGHDHAPLPDRSHDHAHGHSHGHD